MIKPRERDTTCLLQRSNPERCHIRSHNEKSVFSAIHDVKSVGQARVINSLLHNCSLWQEKRESGRRRFDGRAEGVFFVLSAWNQSCKKLHEAISCCR